MPNVRSDAAPSFARDERFDDDLIDQIAEDAFADPRSVWKRLAGGRLRGRSLEARVDRAIAARMPTRGGRLE
jgi:hypothetical protein